MVTPDTPGAEDPGPGRRLGLDVGTVRIGVAASNRDATMAMPVETVQRSTTRIGPDVADGPDLDRILAIIEEYRPVEIIVGLPRDLKGHGSQSVDQAVDIARRIAARTPIPVRFGDERLTTVVATQAMRAAGRSAKKSRSVIDQAAAVEILQTWLDARSIHIKR